MTSSGVSLAGKRLLLTGGSGFLGKPVLAGLLAALGDSGRVAVLLRAPDAAAAQRRLAEEVLANEAFAGLGDLPRRLLAEGRVTAVAADLERGELPQGEDWAAIDTVIHCAATVSFEEPLDDALALNSFGPRSLLERLLAAGANPHFIHVSTAYVTDRQEGVVSEDGVPHAAVPELDPDEMVELGRHWREAAEAESRAQGRLRHFAREAARDAAHRAHLDAAERAEELRALWVRQRLARQGRRHAAALGFPDTYALSKALGERLLAERAKRLTVIRPSIIESALAMPRPGWLEGIKVADPLILAYAARGLTHLPGRAGNLIDIVPVDFVANACVAAAAHPPGDGQRVLAVVSSARNPLRIGELAEHIKAYFRRDPLTRRDGSEIAIGDLAFVPRKTALRKTIRREQMASVAARGAGLLPIRLPIERKLRRNRSLASRVTRMVKIYGPYTELDCVFDDANTQAFLRSLPEATREALPFDTAAIDWEDYLQRIHLPAVRGMARRR